jgi:predicted nucleotide-binding protein
LGGILTCKGAFIKTDDSLTKANSHSKKLEELVESGRRVSSFADYFTWNIQAKFILESTLGERVFKKFEEINKYRSRYPSSQYEYELLSSRAKHDVEMHLIGDNITLVSGLTWQHCYKQQMSYLEGLVINEKKRELTVNSTAKNSNKIFIVHGHDEVAKLSVEKLIKEIELEPIILHEKADAGKTIIEKFETHSSDVGFAIVLLTPDDEGRKKGTETLQLRARQNVIFELGYFIGKLSRQRVCALYKPGVEFPSDYQGVLYTEMDQAGGWKLKLARELEEAGFSVNFGKIR